MTGENNILAAELLSKFGQIVGMRLVGIGVERPSWCILDK